MTDMAKAAADHFAKQFAVLHERMWEMVGSEACYPITPCIDSEWHVDNGAVWYGDPPLQLDGDDTYGGDIYGTSVFRGKHYTIVVYDNGCGDRRCAVLLDNTKEVA